MRLLLVCLLATSALLLVSAAPACPSLPVKLELRTSATEMDKFSLVFASLDPEQEHSTEFIDIHYRINNEDSINLRVMTQDAISSQSVPAKQAKVDGISLMPGDALRAYATYSAKGYACDTPIHTFSAPETERDIASEVHSMRRTNTRMTEPMRRIIMRGDEDQFFSQAAIEAEALESSACPAVPLDQDLVKIQGLDNTFVLSLENRNPAKQLHYVDLHLSTDENKGWDNLRLASDMQLNLAHRVMQPGVVIKPTEQLKWYWSYRATTTDGRVVDCTTPISVITPQEVTHEITLSELAAAASA